MNDQVTYPDVRLSADELDRIAARSRLRDRIERALEAARAEKRSELTADEIRAIVKRETRGLTSPSEGGRRQ